MYSIKNLRATCTLIACSLFSLSSEAVEPCVPSFLTLNESYEIKLGDKDLSWVKIKKIPTDSCWIKVIEVFPKGRDENIPTERKSAFWVNFNNVSLIKKKSK